MTGPKTTIINKKRAAWLLVIIFLLQLGIVTRYAYIQIIWSPKLQKWAVEQWTHDIKIDAKRGKILDRNGNPLAVSGNVERVDAFMKDIFDAEKEKKITREEIAEKLSPILGISKETILAKFNKKLSNGQPIGSVTIARRIEKEQGNKIRELKLPGIVVSEDTKRYYPNGNFLAHVLGNTDIDGNGRAGLEYYYNDILKGVPGRFMGETDKFFRELPYRLATYVPPQNGSDIVLTIDEYIQYYTEKALEKGLQEYKAKQISAIVMDPKTGEILVMANKPDYDPNNPVKGSVEEALKLWKNRTVNDSFEPGSVLKILTAAAAIEEGIVSEKDRFVCNGSIKVANRIIRCWRTRGHGIQNFTNILENSCNVGFVILGQKLGKEKLHKYYSLFNLGKKTGIDYPGEALGQVRDVSKVGPVELATESFGQGISVTPIQFITILGSIANDGKMMQPHLVKRIVKTDDEGNTTVVKEFEPKVLKQTISKETANKLLLMLESVVKNGAANKAYIEGYRIGGKTGTAQKVIDGRYAPGKYISSFAAIAPIDDPKVVIFLSIDEPDPSNYYAGSTAAPLAREILEDVLRYMNVQPNISSTNIPKEVMIPEVRGKSIELAIKTLKELKLDYETQGNGTIIYDISPKPGIIVKENTKIALYLGTSENKNLRVAVPDFTGKTKKEIIEIAEKIGLKVEFLGDGIAASQDISPNTEVNKGTIVKIILEVPED
ncbi:stage V sporulation protein D [Caloramator australicus]|uniref:Cell division protein FtsI [Peptidoglycan synthetase] n=1 Tax=Caloramator australicus RC3 TaxID=857293 RepID=I7LJ14_9CLOT|nr:stage V sporulation protein D [Caloramator australicus]CCJ33357.1 Cell division protein FtsI [Peptidoglycan synthetase] [Caloramator australicus RC3]